MTWKGQNALRDVNRASFGARQESLKEDMSPSRPEEERARRRRRWRPRVPPPVVGGVGGGRHRLSSRLAQVSLWVW